MKKDEKIVAEAVEAHANVLALNGIKHLRNWKKKEQERNAVKVDNDGVGVENEPQKQW